MEQSLPEAEVERQFERDGFLCTIKLMLRANPGHGSARADTRLSGGISRSKDRARVDQPALQAAVPHIDEHQRRCALPRGRVSSRFVSGVVTRTSLAPGECKRDTYSDDRQAANDRGEPHNFARFIEHRFPHDVLPPFPGPLTCESWVRFRINTPLHSQFSGLAPLRSH